jgi:DNA-binding IclR family transcriptional regulator
MLRGETDYDVIAEASAGRFLNAATLYVGRSYPLHVSATGKVVLAELDDERIAEVMPESLEPFTAGSITRREDLLAEVRRVRDQGYALLDDELEVGLFAVACPARHADGELFGVVVLQGPTQRMKSSGLPEVISQVRQAAAEIAVAMAGDFAVPALPESTVDPELSFTTSR